MTEKLTSSDVIGEELAECAHEIWSNWMRYLLSVSLEESDGVKIPSQFVERWKHEMETPYADLSEKEKDSYREKAIKMLMVLWNQNVSLKTQEQRAFEACLPKT